jgi:uncharacterized RDD family membrane protein YckC
MARTAMYLKHEGVEDLPKAKYYKSDYVGLYMWLTAIAVTVAYFLILFLIACYNFEYIINHLTSINYTVLVVMLIMTYVLMMSVFLVIGYFVYSRRYTMAENGIRVYQNRLKKIFQLNKADRKKKN